MKLNTLECRYLLDHWIHAGTIDGDTNYYHDGNLRSYQHIPTGRRAPISGVYWHMMLYVHGLYAHGPWTPHEQERMNDVQTILERSDFFSR